MRCPFCDNPDTQVIETRESDDGASTRRRRRCLNCDKRFTTYERVELALPAVVKKNGVRTDFDRRKMRASMALALRKRPVSAEAVDAAIHRIEEKLLSLGLREVPSERIELSMPAVVKKNGSRVEFDRRKLRASMALALRKRPVAAEAADAAIHRIEEKLLSLGLREIASEKVGELVMRELKKLDKVAYVRFASVYRSFEDVDEFADVILEVQARKRRG